MSTARVRRPGASLLTAGLLAGALTGHALATPAPAAAAGSTILVDTSVDQDIADGTCTLREAMIAANTNAAYHGCTAGSSAGTDTITFIYPYNQLYLAASLPTVTSALVIDGGGYVLINVAGNAGVNGALQNTAGRLTLRGIEITGADTIVVNVGAGASATLSGMWIHGNSGGSAIYNNGTLGITASTISDNDSASGSAGAIYNNNGAVSVADTTFDSNHATTGGAIYNQGGTLTIDRSTFSSNPADADGGAIFNNTGTLTVADTSFLTNTGNQAAAIYNRTGTLTVARSIFLGNIVTASAGALYLNGGSNTITDSRFGSNGGVYGGAVYVAGPLTMRRSTFEGNSASGGGGAMYLNDDTIITSSTFTDNTAPFGGALYVGDTGSAIGSSTFSDNAATTQGGALFVISPLTAANVTVTRNTAPAGGGIYLNAVSSMTLQNSIVAGNTGGDITGQALLPASTHNVVGPVANLDTFLQPGGVRANGGITDTIRILRATGSPFIDKASSAVCAAAPVSAKDQRGVTRPSACDIGAIELEKGAPVVTSSPKPGLRTDTTLAAGSPRAYVAWKAADPGGAGVRRYVVARSVNGGAWKTLSSSVTGATFNLTVTAGSSFRFRVRAVDWDGNISGWTTGPAFSSRLAQQPAASYTKTWATSTGSSFSGGSTRSAKVAGASASYTFTGRSVSFITTTGPTRGAARIYVNGAYQGTVDLAGMVDVYRAQAWSRTWATSGTRTIKVVVVGTAGRPRVDVDAFAVIR